MKKIYQHPLTTAIEVQPQSILCASPGGGSGFTPIHGTGSGSGQGGVM